MVLFNRYIFRQLHIGPFQKTPHSPQGGKFLRSGGKKNLFLIITVSVNGHPKGVGGLTSNFLCGRYRMTRYRNPYIANIKVSHAL